MIQPKLYNFLGKGGFSKVYLQRHEQRVYACKQISITIESPLEYLLDEINCLRCLSHPNIMRCYGFRLNTFQNLCMLLEYIQGETIDQSYVIPNEEMLFYWIFQLSLALLHMQESGIVHRDLKPRNIMVSQKGIIKIVDFGVSKIMCNSKSDIVGTHFYIAPEIIDKNSVCYASDIWSLGITFYGLTHHHLPFEKQMSKEPDIKKFYNKIQNENIDFDSSKCSGQMISLLGSMLQKNPKSRITPLQILNHSSMKSRYEKFVRVYESSL